MLKYYIALFLVAGAALFYVYLQDPCNSKIREDFAGKYPDYKILSSGAGEGTPDKVMCHVSYHKPDNKQVFKDIWIYVNSGNCWEFSRILEEK